MCEELKPCPFCGGEAIITRPLANVAEVWCKTCYTTTGMCHPEKRAIKRWNTRPEEDRLKDENEALIRHVAQLTARLKAMEEAYAELFKKNVPERIMVIK